MPERGRPASPAPELDRWMRQEADVAAPDRLLEDVFARTEALRQVRGGWQGRLPVPGGRRPGVGGAGWRTSVAGVAVAVVIGLAGVAVGAQLAVHAPGGGGSGSGSGSPGPSPSGSGARQLAVARSHETCARRGSLTVIPATTAGQSSAWVTCGADAEEIVVGSDAVIRRSGLGAIAGDGATQWAIQGDSVVRLDADRAIGRTVRIGTPVAIAVGGTAVWVLDARTGRLAAIGPNGVERSVTPAPAGRLTAIAIAGGSLWALDQAGPAVLRLDPADGRLIASIRVPATPTLLAVAGGAVFAASPTAGTLTRIDPATGSARDLRPALGPDGQIDAIGGSPAGLVVGSRSTVVRLDPADGVVLGAADGPGYVAAVGLDGPTVLVLTEDGTLLEATAP